jgi:hypothetical protein
LLWFKTKYFKYCDGFTYRSRSVMICAVDIYNLARTAYPINEIPYSCLNGIACAVPPKQIATVENFRYKRSSRKTTLTDGGARQIVSVDRVFPVLFCLFCKLELNLKEASLTL